MYVCIIGVVSWVPFIAPIQNKLINVVRPKQIPNSIQDSLALKEQQSLSTSLSTTEIVEPINYRQSSSFLDIDVLYSLMSFTNFWRVDEDRG